MRFSPLLLAAALIVSPATAQDNPPNLEGFWGSVFNAGDSATDMPAPDMIAALPDNTVLVDDTGSLELPQGDYGGLIPTAQAITHAESWRMEDDMTLARVCLPPSLIYAIQGPFPFEIHQTPELIVFKYEYFDQVRLVFMDGREHPVDVPHSKMGFSTGHWEDGDLVIETTRIAASTITNNGLDHSDDIRMVERYRLNDDGTRLLATQWFSDPLMLENNGARWIEWELREGQYVYPYECDPTFALEYGAGE